MLLVPLVGKQEGSADESREEKDQAYPEQPTAAMQERSHGRHPFSFVSSPRTRFWIEEDSPQKGAKQA